MTKKRKIILVVVLLAVILSVLLAKPVIHMVIELFEPGQESLNDRELSGQMYAACAG